MGSREIENLNLFYFLLISLLRWGIRQLVNELKGDRTCWKTAGVAKGKRGRLSNGKMAPRRGNPELRLQVLLPSQHGVPGGDVHPVLRAGLGP